MLHKILSYFKPKKLKNAIVYYGDSIDYSKFVNCDYIILQPSYVNTSNPHFISQSENIYAYVSIGEISPNVKEYQFVKKEWIVSCNKEWGSEIFDIKHKEYEEFLFEKIIDPLVASGFKNLFFDTLDSYKFIISSSSEKLEYETVLIKLIKKIHNKYPNMKLILNRGFEIIQRVSSCIDAVLFESYYFGLGVGSTPYKLVSDADKKWLDIEVDRLKLLGLDIIAVDYLDEENIDKADKAIREIRTKGMIPYVSNRNLNIYGKNN